MATAQSVLLKQYIPSGLPANEHFEIASSPVDIDAPLADGAVIIKLLVLSADPYLRTRIKGAGSGGLFSGFQIGSPMAGFVAGKILRSNSPNWVEGDFFGGHLPFVTVQILPNPDTALWKLTGLVDDASISLAIGPLGMPGATVIAGLNVLQPKQGEVLYVNAAAGAVGGVVGQVAKKVFGCVVIGSAGGPEKCRLLIEEFGFDYAIDYKTVQTKDELIAKIREVSPDGIDLVFENVGGFQFEASFDLLKPKGRIAVCGSISGYNDEKIPPSPVDIWKLIYNQAKIEGFLAGSVLGNPEATKKFLLDMSGWIKEGKVVVKQTDFHGIDQWPMAFQSLFTGGNTGKVVIRL